ncbi:hypothetical protein [Microvirga sp. TS319]|uniref:hypothetical protein n=1 Tax=Microvirga sp. TS319 TaxID=3241165 RepID=UPI00351A11A8
MSDDTGLTAFKVEFAEFRGELRTEFKNLARDVRNLTQKMDEQSVHFVPRKEIEQMNAAVDGRVSSLEDSRTWLVRWIVGAWLAGIATVMTFFSKLPH